MFFYDHITRQRLYREDGQASDISISSSHDSDLGLSDLENSDHDSDLHLTDLKLNIREILKIKFTEVVSFFPAEPVISISSSERKISIDEKASINEKEISEQKKLTYSRQKFYQLFPRQMPATLPTLPTLTLITDDKKNLHFHEIKAAPDGNCLFESCFGGLQQLRAMLLQEYKINSYTDLRKYLMNQLTLFADQKVSEQEATYRRMVSWLLSDAVTSQQRLYGYSSEIKSLLLAIREGVKINAEAKNDKALLNLLDDAFPQYVTMMQEDKRWGGEIEMRLISQCFKIQIIVYQENQKSPVAVIGQNYRDILYLYHRDGNTHYHRLQLVTPAQQRRHFLPVLTSLARESIFTERRLQVKINSFKQSQSMPRLTTEFIKVVK